MRRLGRYGVASVLYHPVYSLKLPTSLIDERRGQRILSFLTSRRLIRPRDVVAAREVAWRRLRRVHDDDYLESLGSAGALTGVLGFEVPLDLQDEFVATQRAMVGGTVQALRVALSTGRPSINLGGGLHHAAADRGQGFCVFNDVAVAVADRRAAGFADPVLVVDLDLHDGEGTRHLFARDASVHTFSVHNRDLGPPDALASTSVALGTEIDDERYLATLHEALPPVLDEVEPGLVIYLAGVDPALDDAIGDWRITEEGLLARDRFVVEEVRRRWPSMPLVILLAGGYGGGAWRHSARFLAWLLGADPWSVPGSVELDLPELRRIAARLTVGELTVERDDDLGLSEALLLPSGRRTRFLGYYSRHGIELALERYGFLEELRNKGFDDVRVELQLDDRIGETVRLLTQTDTGVEALVEVRVRRDRRMLKQFEMLSVEWLLLQDPSARFTPERPRLPGQRYPGLGMLGQVSSLLVLACERLVLDGLVFVPAHYHVAAQAAVYDYHFMDPRDEGRFNVLRRTFHGLRLLEALRALEEGRVVDTATQAPVDWQPAPMVLATSARLRARFAASEHRDAVSRAERGCSLSLTPSEPTAH